VLIKGICNVTFSVCSELIGPGKDVKSFLRCTSTYHWIMKRCWNLEEPTTASDVCSTWLQPRESSSEQNANLYNTNPEFLDGLKKNTSS